MKISELIKTLQTHLQASGDIPIQFCSDEGGWIRDIIYDPIIYTRIRTTFEAADGKDVWGGDVTVQDFFNDNDKILQFGFDIRVY